MTEDRFPVDPDETGPPESPDGPPPPPTTRPGTSPAPASRAPVPTRPPPAPPSRPPGDGAPWSATREQPPVTPGGRPRPSALDATLLPLWIIVGQLLAGFAVLPGLLFAEDPQATGRVLLAVSVVLGWAAVVVGTGLWLRERRAWDRSWLVGHRPRSAWLPALAGVGGAIGGFVVVQVVVGLLTWVTGAEPPEQQILELLDDPVMGWTLTLVAVLVAPVVEETVFRGVMLDVMARRWPWWWAAVAQAAVFSAIHIETRLSPSMFLGLGLLGLTFAWLRRVTGSLVAPVVAHLVFNAVSLGLALGAPS